MIPCDLVLTDARIVDVFRLRVFEGWVGIRDGTFLYVEEGEPPPGLQAGSLKSLEGRFLLPGFVDSHMHIESSLLTPGRFAEAVLPHGTTTVLADPHEVANAGGSEGLGVFIEACRHLPLDIRIAFPSCVPATSPELEWTREVFHVETLKAFKDCREVIALGEVMDYQRLLEEVRSESGQSDNLDFESNRRVAKDEGTLRPLIVEAHRLNYLVEGHVPTLRGLELSEYLYRGIGSDHTLTYPEKLLEQMGKGLAVMLQAKSLTPEVIQTVMSLKDRSRVLLVTDDVEPSLLSEGHLSSIIRMAVSAGYDPIEAIASATIRPARYLGLDRGMRKKGGIAPGYAADFLIQTDLTSFNPEEVYTSGTIVGKEGQYVGPPLPSFFNCSDTIQGSIPLLGWESSVSRTNPSGGRRSKKSTRNAALPGPFHPADFAVVLGSARGQECWRGRREVQGRVVRLLDDRTSLTDLRIIPVILEDGFPCWEGEASNCCAVSVISREGSFRTLALVDNLGLKRGAFATSFSHDSHNLLVVGKSPVEMAEAANRVGTLTGGIVVVENGDISAELPLPIFGILSDRPSMEVADKLERIENRLREMGIRRARPFLILSLLSLSVSPYFKITDRGIVDTERRVILEPFFLPPSSIS